MRILLGKKRMLKGRIPGISSCFLVHSIENTKQTMIPATVYSVKWCPTLCDPMNYKVRGILQARILEWVAFPFSRGSSQPRDRTQVSLTANRFFTTWATRAAQEHWSGEPLPSPVHLPDPTQEWNQGLLHCRWILHQLSCQGSPLYYTDMPNPPWNELLFCCFTSEKSPSLTLPNLKHLEIRSNLRPSERWSKT